LGWSSADAAIAHVDQDGRVNAMRDGVRVISAQFAGRIGARTVRDSLTFGLSVVTPSI
jgi:hypothetical protein